MDQFQEQLAREELSGGETSALLERLAHEELGGSGMSTLSDIAEATGTPVAVLARMLAEIRKVPELQERLDFHSANLRALRADVKELKGQVMSANAPPEPKVDLEPLLSIENWERENDRKRAEIAVILALIVIVGVIWLGMDTLRWFRSP